MNLQFWYYSYVFGENKFWNDGGISGCGMRTRILRYKTVLNYKCGEV
jgi:hypothetical protein